MYLQRTPFGLWVFNIYSSFHFLFHYPYTIPLYNNSLRCLFHYSLCNPKTPNPQNLCNPIWSCSRSIPPVRLGDWAVGAWLLRCTGLSRQDVGSPVLPLTLGLGKTQAKHLGCWYMRLRIDLNPYYTTIRMSGSRIWPSSKREIMQQRRIFCPYLSWTPHPVIVACKEPFVRGPDYDHNCPL